MGIPFALRLKPESQEFQELRPPKSSINQHLPTNYQGLPSPGKILGEISRRISREMFFFFRSRANLVPVIPSKPFPKKVWYPVPIQTAPLETSDFPCFFVPVTWNPVKIAIPKSRANQNCRKKTFPRELFPRFQCARVTKWDQHVRRTTLRYLYLPGTGDILGFI